MFTRGNACYGVIKSKNTAEVGGRNLYNIIIKPLNEITTRDKTAAKYWHIPELK